MTWGITTELGRTLSLGAPVTILESFLHTTGQYWLICLDLLSQLPQTWPAPVHLRGSGGARAAWRWGPAYSLALGGLPTPQLRKRSADALLISTGERLAPVHKRHTGSHGG